MKTPSPEERVWAVLAHLSALAFGMGLILPVIGWAEQRRKSKYVAYQCLQALGYQTLGYTVWLLGYLLFIAVIIVVMMVVAIVAPKNENALIKYRHESSSLTRRTSLGSVGASLRVGDGNGTPPADHRLGGAEAKIEIYRVSMLASVGVSNFGVHGLAFGLPAVYRCHHRCDDGCCNRRPEK